MTGNLVAVLGLLKDKDHSKMLENLDPCFEKVFAVTPDSPRAMTAEELEEEAKYHMDAEAAPSVAKAIRLAVDYADGKQPGWCGGVRQPLPCCSGPSTAAQRSGKVTPIPTKYAHSALYTGNIPQQQGAFCCYYQK